MIVPCAKAPDDFMFPLRDSAWERQAVALCQDCPIKAQCALEAIEEGVPFGVWGGTTEKQREAIWHARGGRPQGFESWREFAKDGLAARKRAEMAA